MRNKGILVFCLSVLVISSCGFASALEDSGDRNFIQTFVDAIGGFFRGLFGGGLPVGDVNFDVSRDVGDRCVSPCAVFFDTTDYFTDEEFHDLHYEWDFGDDPDSREWSAGRQNSDGSYPSKNKAIGGVAAHVFELPEGVSQQIYNVKLTVKDGTDSSEITKQVTVYSEPEGGWAETVCVSSSGDFSDPVCNGATHEYTFGEGMSHVGQNRRILFRRGDTFTAYNGGYIEAPGPGLIGAYGNENDPKPIIDFTNEVSGIRFSGNGNIDDWRIMDLELEGRNEERYGIEAGVNKQRQTTLLRLDIHDFEKGVQIKRGSLDTEQNAVVDCHVHDNDLYGLAILDFERSAALGNVVERTNSHNVRIGKGSKTVISNNRMADAGNGSHAIKLHAVGPDYEDEGVCIFLDTPHQDTQYAIISDNELKGSDVGVDWVVGIGPESSHNDQRVYDVIVERNFFPQDSHVRVSVLIGSRNVTVRNNIFDASTTSNSYISVAISQRGTHSCCPTVNSHGGYVGCEPPPEGVEVYNNIAYRNDDKDIVFVYAGSVDSTLVYNNILYAPQSGGVTLVSGTYVEGYNLVNTDVFVNAVGGNFQLDPNKQGAINLGTSVPVWDDHAMNPRPFGSGWDIGAYEYGAGDECDSDSDCPADTTCRDYSCDVGNHVCVSSPINEGGNCANGDFCDGEETCQGGSCIGHDPCPGQVCDEQDNVCTDCITNADCGGEFCDNGNCVECLNDGNCDDDYSCNGVETCVSNVCVDGTSVTQCIAGDGCCPSTCDETNDDDCAALVQGLVLHLPLNGNWDDVYGNPVSCTDCPDSTSDRFGNPNSAYEFNGEDDFLDLNSFDVAGSEMTIGMWFKADDISGCGPRLISKADGIQEGNHWWMMSFCDNSLRVRLKAGGSTVTKVATPNVLEVGEWTHAAFTYDGSMIRIYKDGNEIGTQSKSGALATDASVDSWVGQNYPQDGPFNGVMDDVRIYNRALDANDIAVLAEGGQAEDDCPAGEVYYPAKDICVTDTGCMCGDIYPTVDGKVRLPDQNSFSLCFNLDEPAGDCTLETFYCSDLNGDGSVNGADADIFQDYFNKYASNPNCVWPPA